MDQLKLTVHEANLSEVKVLMRYCRLYFISVIVLVVCCVSLVCLQFKLYLTNSGSIETKLDRIVTWVIVNILFHFRFIWKFNMATRTIVWIGYIQVAYIIGHCLLMGINSKIFSSATNILELTVPE